MSAMRVIAIVLYLGFLIIGVGVCVVEIVLCTKNMKTGVSYESESFKRYKQRNK